MKATLHPYQQEALNAFLAAGKGTLKAHPGAGQIFKYGSRVR